MRGGRRRTRGDGLHRPASRVTNPTVRGRRHDPATNTSSHSAASGGGCFAARFPMTQQNYQEPSHLVKGIDRAIPLATYRLQFNRDFGFDHAAKVASYLAELGVTHIYCSPYLRPRPGSPHGYDIISHTELNPELGDASAFAQMVATFRHHELRQILDFVPNHMGVGGADNPWWLDILQWGRHSQFAAWFDIEWNPDQAYLHDKVLAPFLGEQYGHALKSGALKLKFDSAAGAFAVWAHEAHKLPVCPLHYGAILGNMHPTLEQIGDAFSNLSPHDRYISERTSALQQALAEAVRASEVASVVNRSLSKFEGEVGNSETWSQLDALIQRQHWRPAYFRVAGDDINYRRFFDVNDLARVRMELPELFDHAHALIFRLLDEGVLHGLRIDHIDGLLDPKEYCRQLRQKAPKPLYLVVEKILARHEDLRDDWGVDGATGYEAASLITGLLMDPKGERPLTDFYAEFSGSADTFEEIVRAGKIRVMENELASELNAIAGEIALVARSNPDTADFTKNVLQRALKEIIAVFPVYRTYIDENASPTAADRRDIDWAVAKARRHELPIDPSVFDFLHALLTCDLIAKSKSGFSRTAVVRAAMRVQQFTGPVTAKGVEDTAFYRYGRHLALNEVGGHPNEFRVTRSAFHRANQRRLQHYPHAMLSTSTHDTKRGEDGRARLAVLSECSEEWTQGVRTWSRILRARSAGASQELPPDRNDEYFFYQHLLGAWPPDLSVEMPDVAAFEAFRKRIEGAVMKAMREAKVHTTWALPNVAYEEAVFKFVNEALDVSRKNYFLEAFAPFLDKVATAGMRNSLVQTVLKLTLPGVPDIYQGAELWDFNLVDPDNRRPVDYDVRRKRLKELSAPGVQSDDDLRNLLTNWRDGRVKLFIVHKLLQLRRKLPELFLDGSYEPLTVSGEGSDRFCAFIRRRKGETIIVAVQRYPLRAEDGQGAMIELPATILSRRWTDLFSERQITGDGSAIATLDLFAALPVVVLCASDG
jgi:(1->4)-alpha-D-glucan 1-alpha-D-glucosylmutase